MREAERRDESRTNQGDSIDEESRWQLFSSAELPTRMRRLRNMESAAGSWEEPARGRDAGGKTEEP